MDCHEPDTHWQLLGFYKESGYTKWFEQLFKHQGYCLWNHEGTFKFMYGYYSSWPRQCTKTQAQLSDGSYLYYEMKPLEDANMTVGLYTDWRCRQEYTGDDFSVSDLLGDKAIRYDEKNNDDNMNDEYDWNQGVILGENLRYWNEAMSVYKVCQPCKAYNLKLNYQTDEDDFNNDRRSLEDGNNAQQEENYHNKYRQSGVNDGFFRCYDPAGYTGASLVLFHHIRMRP